MNTGDPILVRIGGDDDASERRPATVVKVWTDESVNAVLMLDGSNDDRYFAPNGPCSFARSSGQLQAWITSVTRGDDVHQWQPA